MPKIRSPYKKTLPSRSIKLIFQIQPKRRAALLDGWADAVNYALITDSIFNPTLPVIGKIE